MKKCGIDEAGRGPLAGPVVVAAVIMNGSSSIEGIKDSKKLSPSKRTVLSGIIRQETEYLKIEVIDSSTIDEINILQAVMKGIERCIQGIDRENTELLIDGNYFKLENDAHLQFSYSTVVKGDDTVYEISCASIMAKTERDRIMEEYDSVYPQYNFRSNKGYGTPEHIRNLMKYGPCEIHRKTFIKKILEQGG